MRNAPCLLRLLLRFVAAVPLALPAQAQVARPVIENQGPAPVDAQATLPSIQPGEIIEELEVIGQRSLLGFRFEMQRAEDRMYAMFNELNGSDDLDVLCDTRPAPGSHIAVRKCVRRYMKEAEATNSADALRGYAPFKSPVQLWGENQAYHREFSAVVNQLMAENPEFVTAIAETVKARDRYTVERKHRAQTTFLGRLLTGQRAEPASGP
jgi:hypothetical protein